MAGFQMLFSSAFNVRFFRSENIFGGAAAFSLANEHNMKVSAKKVANDKCEKEFLENKKKRHKIEL